MNKEKIQEIVDFLRNSNYKDVFGALITYEFDFNEMYHEKLSDDDIKTLEKIYNKFMDDDTITGLINDDLKEIINDEIGE